MKSNKGFFSAIVIASFSLVTLSACDKNDDDNKTNTYNVSATLNGSKEVPANATTGSGALTGTYNADNNTLTYSTTWSGLTGTATLAHFHGPASATATASPVVNFTIVGNTASGVATLTDAQETDLLNGMWYVNVHTSANPGGEIRGQVAATK